MAKARPLTGDPSLKQAPDTSPSGLPSFLSYRITRLHQALNAQAISLLSEVSGLGLVQWRVISMLGSDQARSARDVAAKIGLDPGLLSRTLRSLEDAGYVKTWRPESNRRLLQIELTESGQAIYRKTLPTMQARQAALLSALDPSEREMVFRIIDKLELAAEQRVFDL